MNPFNNIKLAIFESYENGAISEDVRDSLLYTVEESVADYYFSEAFGISYTKNNPDGPDKEFKIGDAEKAAEKLQNNYGDFKDSVTFKGKITDSNDHTVKFKNLKAESLNSGDTEKLISDGKFKYDGKNVNFTKLLKKDPDKAEEMLDKIKDTDWDSKHTYTKFSDKKGNFLIKKEGNLGTDDESTLIIAGNAYQVAATGLAAAGAAAGLISLIRMISMEKKGEKKAENLSNDSELKSMYERLSSLQTRLKDESTEIKKFGKQVSPENKAKYKALKSAIKADTKKVSTLKKNFDKILSKKDGYLKTAALKSKADKIFNDLDKAADALD